MALGVPGVRVGCFTDVDARTGCTVILPPDGTLGGVAVRGGAPGTREIGPLLPTSSGIASHAIVLCGNSIFGLRAADGVQDWLEERGVGLELNGAFLPIVSAAVVFDVREGETRRPTAEWGRHACEAATVDDPPMGLVGVGTGCTAAKRAGREHAVPGGQGWAIASHGAVSVGALMAVNPLGDVVDEQNAPLAADTAPVDHPRFPNVDLTTLRGFNEDPTALTGSVDNTVIGCVVTNASLSKADACRAADLSHNGISRAVRPAHTSVDGDLLFLLATGEEDAHVDLVADLGAQAVEAAIRAAVRASADSPT